MNEKTFASRLKQLREAAGLTQSELAQRAGMNQFGIAKLEQGVREPSWATVRALARALGVTCAAFEVEDPAPPPEEPRAKGRPRKDAPAEGEVAPKGKGSRKRGGKP